MEILIKFRDGKLKFITKLSAKLRDIFQFFYTQMLHIAKFLSRLHQDTAYMYRSKSFHLNPSTHELCERKIKRLKHIRDGFARDK